MAKFIFRFAKLSREGKKAPKMKLFPLFNFVVIQEIFDIGTYEELVERRTIPDYLYSDDEDDDVPKCDESTTPTPTATCDDSTTSATSENGCSTNPFRRQMADEEKMKRNRRKSIHKFIREQQSVDDDIGKHFYCIFIHSSCLIMLGSSRMLKYSWSVHF